MFAGSTGVVDDMHLMSLIEPVVHGKYWRYPGSLTTPPLHESKVWSVMQEPLKMSHKQVIYFKVLFSTKVIDVPNQSENKHFQIVKFPYYIVYIVQMVVSKCMSVRITLW